MRQETALLFAAEEDPYGLLVSQPLEGMKSVFFHTWKTADFAGCEQPLGNTRPRLPLPGPVTLITSMDEGDCIPWRTCALERINRPLNAHYCYFYYRHQSKTTGSKELI